MARMEPTPDFILRGHKDCVNCVTFLSSKLIASGYVLLSQIITVSFMPLQIFLTDLEMA
jgi:hypothetical protein